MMSAQFATELPPITEQRAKELAERICNYLELKRMPPYGKVEYNRIAKMILESVGGATTECS